MILREFLRMLRIRPEQFAILLKIHHRDQRCSLPYPSELLYVIFRGFDHRVIFRHFYRRGPPALHARAATMPFAPKAAVKSKKYRVRHLPHHAKQPQHRRAASSITLGLLNSWPTICSPTS